MGWGWGPARAAAGQLWPWVQLWARHGCGCGCKFGHRYRCGRRYRFGAGHGGSHTRWKCSCWLSRGVTHWVRRLHPFWAPYMLPATSRGPPRGFSQTFWRLPVFHPHASTPSAFGPSRARCAPSFDGAPLQQSHSCLPGGATQHQRAQGPRGVPRAVFPTPCRQAELPPAPGQGQGSPLPGALVVPASQPHRPGSSSSARAQHHIPTDPGGTVPGAPAAFPAAPQRLGTIPGARLQQETRAHSGGEAAVALILPASEEPEQGGLIKTIPWGCGAAEMQGGWRQGGRPAWEMAAPTGTSLCPRVPWVLLPRPRASVPAWAQTWPCPSCPQGLLNRGSSP